MHQKMRSSCTIQPSLVCVTRSRSICLPRWRSRIKRSLWMRGTYKASLAYSLFLLYPAPRTIAGMYEGRNQSTEFSLLSTCFSCQQVEGSDRFDGGDHHDRFP